MLRPGSSGACLADHWLTLPTRFFLIGGLTIWRSVDSARDVNSVNEVLDTREQQRRRCKRLYASVLRCALDDLSALERDAPIPDDDTDHPMTLDQRKKLYSDTLRFFLNPKPSICSLDVICDALEMDADRIRSRVREVLHLGGEIGTPGRRLLSKHEIEEILSSLAAGESSTRLGARYGMNPANIRKVRIRARRRKPTTVPAEALTTDERPALRFRKRHVQRLGL
jgi:hypothetical protein